MGKDTKKNEERRMKDEDFFFSLHFLLFALHFSPFIDTPKGGTWSLFHQQRDEIAQISENKQDTFPTAKLATRIGNYPDKDAAANKHEPVCLCNFRDSHRDDTAACAYHEGDVEDIAADNIPEGKPQAAFAGCNNTCCKLGQARPSCQNGRATDTLAHMALIGLLARLIS